MIEHQINNSNGNYHYNAFVYSDTTYGTHFHASYELIYIIEGNCKISVNETFYNLEKGELFLISPYTIHSINIPKNSRTWIGVFSEDFIAEFVKKNKYKKYGRFKCNKSTESFLKSELFYQGKPEHYMLISCLYMVCNECLKSAQSYDSGIDNKFISNVIKYISENLSENITLAELAEKSGYEYHYFSMLFNQCFSTNFKNFVNILKFQQACKLISDKSLSFTDICNECGFGSIRNFNRIFKSMSGYTPSEYRRYSQN